MVTIQKRQRRDLWKHRKTVCCLTYRGWKPRVAQVILDMQQLVAAFNNHVGIMGWSSRLTLDLSTGGGRVHIHCLLEASPGTTAFKWLRTYWHKRHGRVFLDKRELQNPEGYAIYCNRQAIKTIVLTCNWPQNQTPNLTGNLSKTVHSVNCMVSNSVHSVNCMVSNTVHSVNCTVSNSVTGISSNYSSNMPLAPEYPTPVYDADICCPCEELPSLDFTAEVVAKIATGEECYSEQEVVVDKPVDCIENVPGSSSQGSSNAGYGIELLDAPEYLIPENYNTIVKIESPPPVTLDVGGKPQKGGCFHDRYNPAVSGYVFDMPGMLGCMAANVVAPPMPIRAGPQRALAVIVNAAA